MEFKDFTSLAAVNLLKKLSENPFDLKMGDQLSEGRFKNYKMSSCGIDLLYATQRVDDEVLDGLQALASEAQLIDKLCAMKQGAVMNRIDTLESENRQVLHTACRDIFREQPDHSQSSASAKEQLERLRIFLESLNGGRVVGSTGESFTTMVQVGIGGSDLGPRAICQALTAYACPGRSVRFIANVDPDDAAAVLADLDLSRTLFNIVSKSGTTLETLTNEELVRNVLTEAGLDPALHMVAVTGKGGSMDDTNRYLKSFYMFDYIGGRYSVTSMVGAVSMGFLLGYSGLREFLAGANAMDIAAEERDIRKNIPLLLAMLGIWNHNFLGCSTYAILPYSQALARFPAHLQQCDMESNGKSVSRAGNPVSWQTGPVVWGGAGTNGQHAFYQLLHQGTEVVPAEFIGFHKSQYGKDLRVQGTTSQEKLTANMLAQSLALALGREDENPNRFFAGNRPSLILLADRLTPKTMGALLALYEHRIVLQGFCWNVNSFDQEGVQLGKLLATTMLAAISDSNAGGKITADDGSPGKNLLRVASMVGNGKE
jgi:glucose-6-phosphate isomerase